MQWVTEKSSTSHTQHIIGHFGDKTGYTTLQYIKINLHFAPVLVENSFILDVVWIQMQTSEIVADVTKMLRKPHASASLDSGTIKKIIY